MTESKNSLNKNGPSQHSLERNKKITSQYHNSNQKLTTKESESTNLRAKAEEHTISHTELELNERENSIESEENHNNLLFLAVEVVSPQLPSDE